MILKEIYILLMFIFVFVIKIQSIFIRKYRAIEGADVMLSIILVALPN